MFFFNLSAAEFLALLGAISSLVVALYLLDRSRRRFIVATLRFWTESEMPARRKHRRRIQQPWSLILQLAAITLLLLAIAQLRLGSRQSGWRDHVLLVDASAWMGARTPSGRPLIEEARALGLRYLRSVPSTDRVMLVRADAVASPLTGFESNRQALESALRRIEPGTATLNLMASLDFAAQALRLEGRSQGEIVYLGPGRLSAEALSELPPLPQNLRVLSLAVEPENCGLRKLSARRSLQDPELWEIFVSARNYSRRARQLPLVVSFGGAPIGTRLLQLPALGEASGQFLYRTRAAGWLEARLEVDDALAADDRVELELPEDKPYKVVVYSREPKLLEPLLAAIRKLQVEFRTPEAFDPGLEASLVILDRFQPPQPVRGQVIWIEPPAAASPIPVRMVRNDALLRWVSDEPLAAGLRTRDVRLSRTQVFSPASGDIRIAEVEDGPVILARPAPSKTAVFGFHPLASSLRYELATPLVLANVLRWMAPEIFRRPELQATPVGMVSIAVEESADAASIRVVTGENVQLPFIIREGTLRFYNGQPGVVRITMPDRELVYSLSLPDVAEGHWDPPKTVRAGLGRVASEAPAARDIWQWLALLAGLVLLAEWLLYARTSGAWARMPRLPQSWPAGIRRPERRAS